CSSDLPGNVCELGRELAAIDFLQQREDVLQPHTRVPGPGKPARVELAIEIGGLDAEEIELQHGRRVPFPQTERIEVRDLVAAKAVDLDQARDGRLLLAGRGIGGRCDASGGGAGLRGKPAAQRLADRAVSDLVMLGTDALEEASP